MLPLHVKGAQRETGQAVGGCSYKETKTAGFSPCLCSYFNRYKHVWPFRNQHYSHALSGRANEKTVTPTQTQYDGKGSTKR